MPIVFFLRKLVDTRTFIKQALVFVGDLNLQNVGMLAKVPLLILKQPCQNRFIQLFSPFGLVVAKVNLILNLVV